MPSTLYPLDSTTGETQNCALSHTESRLPEQLRFERNFETRFRADLCDRYGANIRCAKACQTRDPELAGLVFTCDVHKVHSAIKHTLKHVDSAVSGAIHTALATSGGGSLGKLQTILQEVFDQELEIIFDSPPSHCGEFHDQVLNLFCPVHDSTSFSAQQNLKRQYILRRLCDSDITQSRIVHYCMYNCCPSPEYTRNRFMQEVVWALLPHKAPILRRKSWTKGDKTFQWFGVLHSHWDLLRKVIHLYTGSPQPAPTDISKETADAEIGDPDPEAIEAIVEGDGDQYAGVSDGTNLMQAFLEGNVSLAEVNKGYAKKASAFCRSVSFKETFAVTAKVLKPAMSLLSVQLEMAGLEWELRQQYQASVSQHRTYQVVETAANNLLTPCFVEVFRILLSEPSAIPLACYVRRARSLQFRLCSALVSALHFNMRRYHSSFPWQLFLLLKDKSYAESIYKLPACLWDTLATRFFSKFPTPEQGTCSEALALLELVASTVDVDISSVETAHSSTREYAMARSRGHVPTLQHVSALTVFRFVRKWYEDCGGQHQKAQKNNNSETHSDTCDTRKRRSTVGAWNAFLSQRLNGRAISKDVMKQLKQEYHALTHDEHQEFYELGLSSTLKTRSSNALLPAPFVNAKVTDLVVSPLLSIEDFDRFVKHQAAERRKQLQEKKQLINTMEETLGKVRGDGEFLSSLCTSGGAGLVMSLHPRSKSSRCVAQHYDWKPAATSFAKAG